MRKPVFVVSLFALTLAVAPACATKGFVREEVGQVNEKVGTMGKSLEETQERVRQNEGRITEVDAKAAAAQSSATEAQQAANTANDAAAARRTAWQAPRQRDRRWLGPVPPRQARAHAQALVDRAIEGPPAPGPGCPRGP